MKCYHFFLVFLLISVGIFFILCKGMEAGSIYGIVTDQKSGQPVGSVEVVVGETSLKTVTNDSGYYFISGIGRKDYTVLYICPGYDTAEVEATEMKKGEVYQIDVALVPESSD